ncbi:MAG: hypothetical protein PHI70_04920 [Proteiniphilum sp.]|nr:hypothetical protein [Proteiniphilum sp.]MDD3909819.1 hypothetical protein [Proteiniphilum sp.]MDD4416105.1 hypothetical protein [Proteiniphilum sp.]
MKRIVVLNIVLCISFVLSAQKGLFPEQGTVMTYQNFDKKGKSVGKNVYLLESIVDSGNKISVTYLISAYDEKDKLTFSDRITMEQVGDKMYFDMSSFVNKAAFQQDGEIPASVIIEGNGMEIPVIGEASQTLPDADITITAEMGFISMKMTTKITNRRIEAVEDMTVPAGTFSCMKILGDVSGKAMGISTSGKNIQWYAAGVGMVKSESYDKKEKLIGYTILTSLKK